MQNPKIDIIIIRGCPASGKSHTAKKLSKYFPDGVRLEVDTLRQMVISVDWTNQQEHINLLQVSAGLVLDFLKLGFRPIIVIDTFSGNKINKYLETLYRLDKKILIKLFGLFTSDEELNKRLGMRTSDQFRDFSVCKKLNDDVINFKQNIEFQIDTTGLLPTETAEIIYGQTMVDKYYSR